MMLWSVLAIMTGAAIFAVLWPLSRRNRIVSTDGNLAIYRDQIEEVGRDLQAGLIGAVEAEAARLEISRRMLAAADANAAQASETGQSSLRRRRIVALVALVALPIFAGGLYLSLGSPQQPGAPLSSRAQAPMERRSIESMVAQIEAHLERNPTEGQGWEVLAPVYMRLGRFEDAVKARRNALQHLGATAARESDLGEALTGAANGIVTADARAAFERAAGLDAGDLKAQYFLGLAAEQDGKVSEAARIWTALLARIPEQAAYRPLIEQSLARIKPDSPQAGPGAADIAAAESLPPEQRAEMVRAMVARLAARLKQDGSDTESWLRLVRAYMVLGEPGKAREAASDARKAAGTDREKQRRLDEAFKGLGIEG